MDEPVKCKRISAEEFVVDVEGKDGMSVWMAGGKQICVYARGLMSQNGTKVSRGLTSALTHPNLVGQNCRGMQCQGLNKKLSREAFGAFLFV